MATAKSKVNLENYVEVPERIQRFKAKYPEGYLQAEITHLTDTLVVVRAFAFREPSDTNPGTGLASEPIPGKTPYTRDSEVMNCETSAWGRAIAALGFDFGKIASREEVRNRQYTDTEVKKEATTDDSNVVASGVI